MKKQFLKCLGVAALALSAVLPASTMAAGYTQTKYPIVLVHGFFGFDNIGTAEYFYGVPDTLRADGANVYVSQVSASNSTEVRGEQLLTYIKQVMAATGAKKVNIIGHSHGGPTARYVAGVAPNLVASVTSVGGPNKGGALPDVLLGVAPNGTYTQDALTSIVNGFSSLVALLSNDSNPQNSSAALNSLTTTGMAAFNKKFPEGVPTTACGEGAYQVNGVYYFSWSGAQPLTNPFDPSDAQMAMISLADGFQKTDGLVTSCSSHLGRVIRDDYRMNHLDEVNQLIGLVNIFETNPKTVYRQHANRLQLQGL
jgi:triacylglycerol lipase